MAGSKICSKLKWPLPNRYPHAPIGGCWLPISIILQSHWMVQYLDSVHPTCSSSWNRDGQRREHGQFVYDTQRHQHRYRHVTPHGHSIPAAPSDRRCSNDRAAGARPEALIPWTLPVSALKNSAKASPPIPVDNGSTNPRVAAMATAASAAFPPRCRIWIPAAVASGCVDAAWPLVVYTAERRDCHGWSIVVRSTRERE
jgi:hypothetical protein